MIKPEKINTHTLYSRYARLQKLAEETIKRYGKLVDPQKNGNPSTNLRDYIAKLDAMMADPRNASKKAQLQAKKSNAQQRLAKAEPEYQDAQQNLPNYIAEQEKLKTANDVFYAPPKKRDEYLYVLDEETCKHLCHKKTPQNKTQDNTNNTNNTNNCRCTLFGPKEIELTGNQTDALRVWNNNSHIKNISIIDNRSYNKAHRDAIQLIPPKKIDPTRKIKIAGKPSQAWMICDQMSGAILENVTIEACRVRSPKGPLQGIFSSDGFFTNLKVLNNDIQTAGSHSIVFNGMLSGEISGNTLRQVGNKAPAIHLYPARFGGNQAEEGMAYILGFANESTNFPDQQKYPRLAYDAITERDNTLIDTTGTKAINIINQRDDISETYRWMSFGLEDFQYHAFQQEFSTLTFGDYKRDPRYQHEFAKLKAWLQQKIEEFTTGRRVDNGLPALRAGDEKLLLIGTILQKAFNNAINSNRLDAYSLSNFPETPIRTFTMKQVALKYGKLRPLVALNHMGKNSGKELEKRRKATLKHLLTNAQLNNIKPNPKPDTNTDAATGINDTPDNINTTPKPIEQAPQQAANALPKSYGDLAGKILVSPRLDQVGKGDILRFSINTSDYELDDLTLTYFWSLNGTTSNNATFTVNTTNIPSNRAEHIVKVTLYAKQGWTVKKSWAGSAIFSMNKNMGKKTNQATKKPPQSSPQPAQESQNTNSVDNTTRDKQRELFFSFITAIKQGFNQLTANNKSNKQQKLTNVSRIARLLKSWFSGGKS
ncbi:MAG TPA: hypothetical protein ENJ33_02660, partial [Thiothrix sp.]|nr:hypothetical protein [Thiothrix sp.]